LFFQDEFMEWQQMTTTVAPVGFLGRIPAVLFAVVCGIAGIVGSCLTLIVAAICFAIVQAIVGPLKSLEAPVVLIAMLGGLVLPVYWLITKRRKQQPRIEPMFGSPADREIAGPAAMMKTRDPIPEAPLVAAAAPSPTSRTQLPTGAKWAIGVAAVVVGLALLAGLQSSDSLDIEVRQSRPQFTNRATLHITNISSSPTTVLDVLLNDRMECSMLASHVRSAFLEMDRTFTDADFHEMWVYTGDGVGLIMLGGLYHRKSAADLHTFRKSLRPVELKTGDTRTWSSSCDSSLIRATVTTNKGSASYSFSR
jgi:hypothetical protein